MPGLRKWSINVNQGESIFCHMIIEQFDDFDKFIEVYILIEILVNLLSFNKLLHRRKRIVERVYRG